MRSFAAVRVMLIVVYAARCAPGLKETKMRTMTAVAGALIVLASTTALSQGTSRDQSQRQQQMQPGSNEPSPAPGTDGSSQGGMQAGSSESGTLMQRREQGMSPNSSKDSGQDAQSTGKIKQ